MSEHDLRFPTHPHNRTDTHGSGEKWRTTCQCQWASPVCSDRRTARQAHYAHHQENTL